MHIRMCVCDVGVHSTRYAKPQPPDTVMMVMSQHRSHCACVALFLSLSLYIYMFIFMRENELYIKVLWSAAAH